MSLHSRHSGRRSRRACRNRSSSDGASAQGDRGTRHLGACDVSPELEYAPRSSAAHLVNLDPSIELRSSGTETDYKPLQAVPLVHVQELAIDNEYVSAHWRSARTSFDDKSQVLQILDERISQIVRDGMRGFELTLLRRLFRLNRAKGPMDDALIQGNFGG